MRVAKTQLISRVDWLVLAVSLLPLALMVSAESLWIDEAQTVTYAKLGSFGELYSIFVGETKSEALMPFSMFLAWVWAQVFGLSELALRLPNLIYLGGGAVAMWQLGRKIGASWLAPLFMVNPFVWQYANEARPYSLQLGLAAALVLCAFFMFESHVKSMPALIAFFGVGWLLSAASLLAAIPFVVLTVILCFFGFHQRWRLTGRQWSVVICFGVLYLLLGGFFLWALGKGSSGAKLWPVGIGNLIFAYYELSGFFALGPGRNDLREAALMAEGLKQAVIPFLLPFSLGIIVLLGALVVGKLPKANEKRNFWLAMVCFLFVSSLGLFLLAKIVEFPFWGRHLAPLLPALVVVMTMWIASASKPLYGRLAATALLSIWLAGALQVRFAGRFAKDDYRSAASIAWEAIDNGKTVWWAADAASLRYYSPQVQSDRGLERLHLVHGPDGESPEKLSLLDVVIVSKPDVYDSSGLLRKLLKDYGFIVTETAQSFSVYRGRLPSE